MRFLKKKKLPKVHLYQFLILALSLLAMACGKEGIAPNNYEAINSTTTLPLQTIRFMNADTGFIVGGNPYSDGIILQTSNGGQTWQARAQNDIIDKKVYDIMPVNTTHVLASAFDSKLLRSYDSGNTWELIQTGISDIAWQPLRSLWLLSDTVAIAVGGQATFTGVVVRIKLNNYEANYQILTGQLNDVWFTDAQTGYACGYGIAYKTTDGGNTWQYMEARGDDFTAICFASPSVGYMVGAQGTILKTIDSGNTWQKIHSESVWNVAGRSQLNDVLFISDAEGWVAGNKVLWHTTDGGTTWQCYEGDFKDSNLNGIAQHPNGDIWVVGDEGNIWRVRP